MLRFLKMHKQFWDKQHIISLMQGTIIFCIALIIQNSADSYIGKVQGIAVEDLFLSNIPVVNTNFFIIEGALILTFISIVLILLKPKYLLFTLKAFSLFIIVRSFFISLTHLGVDPHQLQIDTDSIGFGLYNLLYHAKGDFFFSGHTGLPFLMALILWREKMWRYFFLTASCVLGICVLLGHIHYSIDVFAAPFMTYGIFTICHKLFPKDYRLLN